MAKSSRYSAPGKNPEVKIALLERSVNDMVEQISALQEKIDQLSVTLKEAIAETVVARMENHELRCKHTRAEEQKACRKEYQATIAAAKTEKESKSEIDQLLDSKKFVALVVVALGTMITLASDYVLEKKKAADAKAQDRGAISAPK